MMNIAQYVGQTFGRRTVLAVYPPAKRITKPERSKCDALCACGKIDRIALYPLVAGISNQCRDCVYAAMVDKEKLNKILLLKEAGLSNSAISKDLGISRPAVVNMLKRARARPKMLARDSDVTSAVI